ncbi:hypothetical protein D3C85_13930 [compost metagenome]
MSFLEAMKEAAGAVVEAIQENPVAAGVGAVVVAAGVGGTIWYRRRKTATNVKDVIAKAELVAAAGNEAVAAANASMTAAA